MGSQHEGDPICRPTHTMKMIGKSEVSWPQDNVNTAFHELFGKFCQKLTIIEEIVFNDHWILMIQQSKLK